MLRVLTATQRTQGLRDDDFCHGVEGELVRLPTVSCGNSKCGCDRALAGLASSKATTTAEIIEHPSLDLVTYRGLVRDALVREGWVVPGDEVGESFARELADEQALMAAIFEPGTVVEYRDDVLSARA